jgi:acetoin utilization protein AcuB
LEQSIDFQHKSHDVFAEICQITLFQHKFFWQTIICGHICPGSSTVQTVAGTTRPPSAFSHLNMTAKTLIAHDIPALSLQQTGRDAFHLLSDYHVKHLPVVHEGKLMGILSEEEVFHHKLYEPISEYDFSLMRRAAVVESEHVFEVMRLMGDQRLTVIPVVDADGNYQGLVSQNDLLRYFAQTASFTEHGAVLVLQMPRRDYSLSTIAHFIEDEKVKVLSAFVTSTPDPETVELTLKLDRTDLSRVIASLERHEYDVKETFGEVERTDAMRERYDALMHYLNL